MTTLNIKPSNLSITNQLPKFRQMLETDIQILRQLISDQQRGKFKVLLNSLIQIKGRILSEIPGPRKQSPSLSLIHNKSNLTTYRKAKKDAINEFEMAKVFYKIEKDQMTYLQRMSAQVGIPKVIAMKIKTILQTYAQVLKQLEEMIYQKKLGTLSV